MYDHNEYSTYVYLSSWYFTYLRIFKARGSLNLASVHRIMYISTNVDTYIKSETDILKEETREIFKVGTET